MHIKTPVGNRLLVQPLEPETISSVLHIPPSRLPYMNSSAKSRVLKIGTGVRYSDVKEGDIVIHNCQMGYPVPASKDGLLLLAMEDVLAVETPLEHQFYSSPVSKAKITG